MIGQQSASQSSTVSVERAAFSPSGAHLKCEAQMLIHASNPHTRQRGNKQANIFLSGERAGIIAGIIQIPWLPTPELRPQQMRGVSVNRQQLETRSTVVHDENLTDDEVLERREGGGGELELGIAPLTRQALGVEQFLQIRTINLSAGRLGEHAI